MTASRVHAKRVAEAIHGKAGNDGYGFLVNFKKCLDHAAPASVANVSTKIFYDTRTLAGSANELLDLADGIGVPFAKVHAIYVKPAAANHGNIVVGASATTPFIGPFGSSTASIQVAAGQEFLITSLAGWVVGDGTADMLEVANSDTGPATYDIIILGE